MTPPLSSVLFPGLSTLGHSSVSNNPSKLDLKPSRASQGKIFSTPYSQRLNPGRAFVRDTRLFETSSPANEPSNFSISPGSLLAGSVSVLAGLALFAFTPGKAWGLRLMFVGAGIFAAGCGSEEVPSSPPSSPSPPTLPSHVPACEGEENLTSISRPDQPMYFPIAIHGLLSPDLPFPIIPRNFIEGHLQVLNEAFLPANIQFYLSYLGKIEPNTSQEHAKLDDFKSYLLEGAINVVLVPFLDEKESRVAGRANYYRGFVGGYNYSTDIWIHEMGHVFGLYHPHQEIDGTEPTKELVDGSNGWERGDLLPDTPADPGQPDFVFSGEMIEGKIDGCLIGGSCEIIFCPTDANEQTYRPNPRLYMSYYDTLNGCRTNQFSPFQIKKMICSSEKADPLAKIKQDKPLGLPPVDHLTVGCDSTSLGSIEEAISKISMGKTIEVCEGTYPESLDIAGSLSLMGREGHRVIVEGSPEHVSFFIDGESRGEPVPTSVHLENLTFTHGTGSYTISSTVSMNQVTITNNQGPNIFRNSHLSFQDCSFDGNLDGLNPIVGVALTLEASSAEFTGGSISDNRALTSTQGAAVLLLSKSTFRSTGVNWRSKGPNVAHDVAIIVGTDNKNVIPYDNPESKDMSCSHETQMCTY